jgi:hypothetical protein
MYYRRILKFLILQFAILLSPIAQSVTAPKPTGQQSSQSWAFHDLSEKAESQVRIRRLQILLKQPMSKVTEDALFESIKRNQIGR